MATVVHEHETTSGGNNSGTLLAIVLLVVLAVLFFMYGLPMLTGGQSGTNVNLPSSVNVNTK